MRKPVALLLGVLVPLLGLAGVADAQSTVQVQGTIQAVDCQAQTLVVATPSGVNTIAVAPYTAVLVDSSAVSLCDLQSYVGSPVTVWLVANGNEFVATRIDTTAQAAAPPVAVPQPVEASVSPLPIVGVVLGTIVVAGLIYLLVRDNDRYYRYPYYGDYYGYYYHPEYRPYFGYYPPICPIVFAAAVITGVVLGVRAFDGDDYLIVRERDGRFARYPYFGPYRQHYYRPEYRAYTGPYRDAPVRYGEWHRYGGGAGQPNLGRPNYDYNRGPAQYQRPNYQQPYNSGRPNYDYNRGPAQYQRPNYQQSQPYNNGRPNYDYNRAPAQYQRPNYQQPQRPNYQQSQPYNNGRPNYDYNRGPAQYQRPNYQQSQPYNNGRPNYDYNRGPAQYQRPNYQQPQYQRPNYQQPQYQRPNYQQPQRPSYNSNPGGGYNRGGYGGGRGQDTRRTCNSGDSCSDPHNR